MSEPVYARPQESVGHRIVRAMFVVIFFQLFWKFGGLIITLLVGSVFRAGPESDAYFFVTETVVFLLQTLFLKLFIPVVVPIFKERLAAEGEQEAWKFGSTVLVLAFLALTAMTVGGMVFAPRITGLIAKGFNEHQAALTTRLMRLMFPGVLAICLATVTYALLNSYNIFGYAAAGDAVQKMIWAGVFLAASFTGLAMGSKLDALALAFLLGAVATLAVHLLGLRSKLKFLRLGLPGLSWARIGKEGAILGGGAAVLAAGLWACSLAAPHLPSAGAVLVLQQVVLVVVVSAYLMLLWWRARGRVSPMAKFAALLVPLLFGILFAKYRDLLTNLFASFTGTGVFSDLKYARKIGEAPNTLIIAALSIAILPHLCELATGKRWDLFGDVMTRTIRIIVIFFVPLAALTVVLRRPIIQLLFDRGDWGDYHLAHAGDALGLYILSLPFFAIENPIQQSFFAMQRMWTPTLIGFLGTGFHILFLFVGIEWLGFGYFAVVALVYVAARAFKNVVLVLVMRYHVKILPWKQSVVFLAKGLVVTLGVVLATYYTWRPVERLFPLAPYRRHEVTVDTFNVELKDWESENVDDLAIEPAGEPTQGMAGNVLKATYRPAARRSAGLRRDLTPYDLTKARALSLDIVAPWQSSIVLELVTRSRQSYGLAPVPTGSTAGGRVVRAFEGAVPADALPQVVALWIRDVAPSGGTLLSKPEMLVDNLALELADGTRLVLDDFESAASNWRLEGPAGGRPKVEDTGERADPPELALHFRSAASEQVAVRSLEGYALAGCDLLRFKARADKPVAVGLSLDGAHGLRTATVEIAPSEKRKTYSVPVSAFSGSGGPDFGDADAVSVRVPAGGDLWLDNVAFVREPKGMRMGALSVNYELFKLLHVAVPAAAALVAFVVLMFALRIEEARDAWQWIRQVALKKVLARLGR